MCFIFLLFYMNGAEALCKTTKKPAQFLHNADACRKVLYGSMQRQKYRHNWLKCIHRYKEIYTRYPKSDQAAWALYQSARLFTGLYTYSGRFRDLDEAVHLYRRLVDNTRTIVLLTTLSIESEKFFTNIKKISPKPTRNS